MRPARRRDQFLHDPLHRALGQRAGLLIVEAETEAGIVFDFYDREGRIQGSAPAPDRDRRVPPYFRNGHVYVVTRDQEFDVQGVAVYEVRR